MQKFKHYAISLACVILGLSACIKPVQVTLPTHKPALVLNSVFNPDSTFYVDLSSSRNILSNEAHAPVTNASVRLFRNGNYMADLQHSKNGVYIAAIKPESLAKYSITATAPNFPSISARNHIPGAPVLHQIQAAVADIRPNEHDLGVNVSFILDNPSVEENFYFIRAYRSATTSGQTIVRSAGISFLSPIMEDFQIDDRYYFSDKLFKGKPTTLKLHLYSDPKGITYLRIAHITEEYYAYGKTLVNFSYSDTNLNQMSVSNNIENGIGLFAGYNAITIPIKP